VARLGGRNGGRRSDKRASIPEDQIGESHFICY